MVLAVMHATVQEVMLAMESDGERQMNFAGSLSLHSPPAVRPGLVPNRPRTGGWGPLL